MLSANSSKVDLGLYFGPEFLHLFEDVDAADTIKQVTSCCVDFTHVAGAEHFVYRTFMTASGETLCIHNIDPEWVRIYLKNAYGELDPRIRYCFLHDEPILWSDLSYSDDENGRSIFAVMEHASQFGYVDGMSFPLHGVGTEVSIFSLSSSRSLPEFTDMQMQTILAYANKVRSAVKRIQYKLNPKSIEVPALSEREKECLKWTANGKTSWEIGQILDLSESTVVFHISNAINKLGVSNRVQAVVKAITQSQFHLY